MLRGLALEEAASLLCRCEINRVLTEQHVTLKTEPMSDIPVSKSGVEVSTVPGGGNNSSERSRKRRKTNGECDRDKDLSGSKSSKTNDIHKDIDHDSSSKDSVDCNDENYKSDDDSDNEHDNGKKGEAVHAKLHPQGTTDVQVGEGKSVERDLLEIAIIWPARDSSNSEQLHQNQGGCESKIDSALDSGLASPRLAPLLPIETVEKMQVRLKCTACKHTVVPCACCRRALIPVNDKAATLEACGLCGFIEVFDSQLRQDLNLYPYDILTRSKDEIRWIQSCRSRLGFAAKLKSLWRIKGTELQVIANENKPAEPRLEREFMLYRELILALSNPRQRRADTHLSLTIRPPRRSLEESLQELRELESKTQGETQCSDVISMHALPRARREVERAEQLAGKLPELTQTLSSLEISIRTRLQATEQKEQKGTGSSSRAEKILQRYMKTCYARALGEYQEAFSKVGKALIAVQELLLDIFEATLPLDISTNSNKRAGTQNSQNVTQRSLESSYSHLQRDESTLVARFNSQKLIKVLREIYYELTACTMIPVPRQGPPSPPPLFKASQKSPIGKVKATADSQADIGGNEEGSSYQGIPGAASQLSKYSQESISSNEPYR